MAAGDAKSDLLWVIGMLIILGIAWFSTGGPQRPVSRQSVSGSGAIISRPADDDSSDPNRSAFKGLITLGRGSASGATNPNDEYVTIQAAQNNRGPVTITGWKLKSERVIRNTPVDMAVIGTGVRLFLPAPVGSDNQQELITLAPGETAIVTSGKVVNSSPFSITTNFKTNKCSGYIDNLPNYVFSPGLGRNCPSPSQEPGVDRLDDQCYRFIRSMSACHTPNFRGQIVVNREERTGYVDNVPDLSSQCKLFLKAHYNYEACVANHRADQDFSGSTWRVYLNQVWELWDKNREVISLYDQQGKLVDQLTY